MRLLGSLLYWALFTAALVVLFPVGLVVWLVARPFDPRGVAMHRFTSLWAWLYTGPNPAWRVTVEGRERLDDAETYVIVANHQSLVDILVLFRIFAHFRWVSKIENFRLPIVGWVMYMNRYIPLVRGKRESVIQMMRDCEASLNERVSVLIFPEGTRSETGDLRPFKAGAFELARSTGCPLLPIVLDGTSRALPKKGFVLQGRHHIQVRILDPIPPDDFKDLSSQELAERTRAQFADELVKLRGG